MANSKLVLDLIEALKVLPNIGTKNAKRYAYHLIANASKENILNLVEKLQAIAKLEKCKSCFDFALENETLCQDCKDETSFKKIIAIEEYFLQDMFTLFSDFQTKIYVLPIFTKDSKRKIELIEELGDYIAKHKVSEVIFAFSPTYDGEVNARLTSGYLKDLNVTFSKINVGVPIGSSIDYVDKITLEASIKKREKL